MAKRIKIGLIYSYDENWIGGTYYYQYLIQSLNLLPDKKKPHLIILSNEVSSFNSIKKLSYPYISYKHITNVPTLFLRIKNKVIQKFLPNVPIQQKKINFGIDVLFHPSEINIPNSIKKHLYWIPDFQEVYLPHLFSQEYLSFRKESQQQLLSKNKHILFSSQDAYSDFKKLYPKSKSNCYVVNFAVFHPNFMDMDINQLREKYQINQNPYFFIPNQFWKHKNHTIVLKAIKMLKENYDFEFQVLFSGKESDARNPTYFKDLKKYIFNNDLQNYVKFLGFIDRKDQLCLTKDALSVIQPSLFEGWSSVVEDAKAMNQNLIVSSINVHKEQLGEQGYYFNPNDENELIHQMLLFLENNIKRPSYNYNENRSLFGYNFMKIIEKIHL